MTNEWLKQDEIHILGLWSSNTCVKQKILMLELWINVMFGRSFFLAPTPQHTSLKASKRDSAASKKRVELRLSKALKPLISKHSHS